MHWLKIILILFGLTQGAFAAAAESGASDATSLLAQVKKKKTKKKKAKKKTVAPGEETEAAAAPTMGSGITGGEGPVGSLMGAGNGGYVFYNLGVGFEGSYVLMPKLQVGGRFLQTFQKTVKGSAQGATISADISQTNIGGFGRYFFLDSMPSLYALGGMSFSTASGPYELEYPAPAVGQIFYFYSDLKGSALLLTGGIGNQWSWGHWVFGADWFTYSFPISVSASGNPDGLTDVDGAAPPKPLGDAEKSAINGEIEKKVREGAQFQFLLLHAGYRF